MNISPEAGKFWFSLAVGIVLLSGIIMFIVEPGTAAYYINGFSLMAGIFLLLLVIVLVRRSNR